MMYSEPKPENCDIKVVNLSMTGAMTSGEWDTLGMVNYGKSDPSMDPFSPEILSELRPRFCRMGGEAVSLGSSATNDRAASASYMVLRKRPEGAPPAGPPMMLPPG